MEEYIQEFEWLGNKEEEQVIAYFWVIDLESPTR